MHELIIMARDLALDRAVGVMVWHLYNGGTDDEAMARASKREPELAESDLRDALKWAKGACLAAKMVDVAPPDMTLGEILDKCGVPWRE